MMNELEMVRWRRAERIRHAEAWSFGSSQDGAVGKFFAYLPSQLHQNYSYKTTIIENCWKSCRTEALQLRRCRKSHRKTSRRGRDVDWAGPTHTYAH